MSTNLCDTFLSVGKWKWLRMASAVLFGRRNMLSLFLMLFYMVSLIMSNLFEYEGSIRKRIFFADDISWIHEPNLLAEKCCNMHGIGRFLTKTAGQRRRKRGQKVHRQNKANELCHVADVYAKGRAIFHPARLCQSKYWYFVAETV